MITLPPIFPDLPPRFAFASRHAADDTPLMFHCRRRHAADDVIFIASFAAFAIAVFLSLRCA